MHGSGQPKRRWAGAPAVFLSGSNRAAVSACMRRLTGVAPWGTHSSSLNFDRGRVGGRERSRAWRRALARRPKRHSSSEQSSAHCAVTSRATLAAGHARRGDHLHHRRVPHRQVAGSVTLKVGTRFANQHLLAATGSVLTGYGTRPHPLTLHIHNRITLLVPYCGSFLNKLLWPKTRLCGFYALPPQLRQLSAPTGACTASRCKKQKL